MITKLIFLLITLITVAEGRGGAKKGASAGGERKVRIRGQPQAFYFFLNNLPERQMLSR